MSVERALWLIVLCAVAYAAWHVRGCQEPETVTVTRTDTTYVDRVVPKVVRDTVTVTRPVERIVYRQTTDTVYVRLPVPQGFTARGLVGANSLAIDGRTVTLTRWDSEALRFTQDVYAIEEPDWRIYPEIGAERTAYGPQATARIGVAYGRRLSGYVGYAEGFDHRTWTAGVRYKLFTLRF